MPPELSQAAREDSLIVTNRDFQQKDREEISEANEMSESVCGSESENVDPTSQKADTPSSEQDGHSPADQEEVPLEDTVEEDEGEVISAAHRAAYPNATQVRHVFEEEKESGRMKMRYHQASLHHTFTNLRIEDLERGLKELKAAFENRDDTWEAPKRTKFPIHRHELRRSYANQFRITRLTAMLHCSQQPALEVQVTERISPILLTLDNESQNLSHQMPGNAEGIPLQSGSLKTPERLRIRSWSLLSHLEKITGRAIMGLAQSTKMDGVKVHSGVAFLRPFKFFAEHHDAIRKSHAELEAWMHTGTPSKHRKESQKQAVEPIHETSTQHDFDDKNLVEDLKLLIHFLDNDLKSTLDLRQKVKDGTALEIEYDDLWHLFARGDIVITPSDPNQAYRVINMAGGREPLQYEARYPRSDVEKPVPVDGFVLDCLSFGSDGTAYIPKLQRLPIHRFHGKRLITSLPVYPLRFDPKQNALRAEFEAMGTRFLDLTRETSCHKLARGKTLDEPSHDLDNQVIVDMRLAMTAKTEWRMKTSISSEELTRRDKRETIEGSWCYHREPGCCGGDVIFNDLVYDEEHAAAFGQKLTRMLGPLQEEDLTEEDLMLMQPYVYAFVLRSRQWATIWTTDLKEVVFENNFNDLVISEDHKETVRALVKTHENKRAAESSPGVARSVGTALDLVKGKGAGLVILLHGPPGVGKTSTAECVADDTHRPLFPITCGDIGETAAEVETNLQYSFKLAHKWGCVLLLDEADIFLAKRVRDNIRHNAVTSVFLRTLEYYAGILFLTSNRVGAIDPAFKSRIQMSLSYNDLDLPVTLKIYEKFIKRAKEEQHSTGTQNFKIKEKEIMSFAEKHYNRLELEGRYTWNGRQIRNAFQTAIALVEYQYISKEADEPKPSLGKKQFKKVARGFKEFDDYLINVNGATEADEARREGWRYDVRKTVSSPTPHRSTQASRFQQGSKHPARNLESEDSSETEKESDNDSEDEVKDGRGSEKKANPSTVGSQSFATAGASLDMEQYQQFLKFQQMMSGGSK
ncbi:AAA family ATPase [Colletotrichum scovillei]|uniref:AAA family ATPase n=1 Tax=Colletotrichum scovillei TaxID=1209932 RepID=A0A9P7R9W6_9PEZI|nr:AAA family ATPase [Colletotrichum scovillei]KAG7071383.1 AAA family ATPase [Colletotrichum scovillei]KAG7079668.1 AAA family ATPase [Colletotrichum scovillei]